MQAFDAEVVHQRHQHPRLVEGADGRERRHRRRDRWCGGCRRGSPCRARESDRCRAPGRGPPPPATIRRHRAAGQTRPVRPRCRPGRPRPAHPVPRPGGTRPPLPAADRRNAVRGRPAVRTPRRATRRRPARRMDRVRASGNRTPRAAGLRLRQASRLLASADRGCGSPHPRHATGQPCGNSSVGAPRAAVELAPFRAGWARRLPRLRRAIPSAGLDERAQCRGPLRTASRRQASRLRSRLECISVLSHYYIGQAP